MSGVIEMCKKLGYLLLMLLLLTAMNLTHAMIHIVAAENVYGNVAKELGGPYVEVKNILSHPNQDPHLFTLTPSTAKAISNANIIIVNGANYDPWMNAALAIPGQNERKVINIADLVQAKPNANPHLWYQPLTMPVFAKALVKQLIFFDPEHQPYYEKQLSQFNKAYQSVLDKIRQMKQKFSTVPVMATEPIFNNMAESLSLRMQGLGFQTNMMNDIPPTITQIKDFADQLTHHSVRVLIYNKQVNNALTERMRQLAEKENIPIVGMDEMLPTQLNYIAWMMQTLNAMENALNKNNRRKNEK